MVTGSINTVITGSTRGIGLGLAREYLRRGHSVMISGRNQQTCDQAVTLLQAELATNRVFAQVCDVTDIGSVEALWDSASATFGRIDHWINNAGRNNPKAQLDKIDWPEIESTIDTNLLGVIRGSVVAYRGMLRQGSGWIFNMEGFGAEGMIGLEQVPYGVTKYGVRYVTKALVKTAAGSPVCIGYLSPGMVTTEMAVPQADRRDEFFFKNRKVLNILADHVETVTPWLVERMLVARKNGTAIRWMGFARAAGRFMLSLVYKRHVIEEAMSRQDNQPTLETSNDV
ncbi:MAG: SDR family oxidoreductase [Gammaproteobacteria bacterium]|nr:SDR family oxidoreductase [Gammaproteobacteria bacterium]